MGQRNSGGGSGAAATAAPAAPAAPATRAASAGCASCRWSARAEKARYSAAPAVASATLAIDTTTRGSMVSAQRQLPLTGLLQKKKTVTAEPVVLTKSVS
jgi:hypothetical protein